MKHIAITITVLTMLISSTKADTLTLQLTEMTPHVGQLFEVRLFNNTPGYIGEVSRARVKEIPSADFSVSLPGLVTGHDYQIDFFADFNDNGRYDPPPADHAWRLLVSGDVGTVTFTHNTNFTNIKWVYLLKLDLTGFTPHVGQLFEARLVNITAGFKGEVSRARIGMVPMADFSVILPGLVISHDYEIDFYADLNQNGMYNPPPVDHAWRLLLQNAKGDTGLAFPHNTNFINIGWPLLAIDDDGRQALPGKYALHQNYPNPFNPVTTLRYELPERSEVLLTIHDVLGRQVRTLVRGAEEPGFRTLMWDGTNDLGESISAGVYLYRIQAGDFTQTRKMVLLR